MAYPKALLSEGEEVVLDLHPHAKALVLPAAVVLVVLGAGSFLAAELPDNSARTPLRWTIFGVGLVLILWFAVRPWLRWLTTHYVVTTRRIVHRSGVLSRSGRDVPLGRVNDVSFQHNLFERMLRCGTLIIESAGERGQVVLSDVPRVESVQRTVYELVQADERRGAEERRRAVERDDRNDGEATPAGV